MIIIVITFFTGSIYFPVINAWILLSLVKTKQRSTVFENGEDNFLNFCFGVKKWWNTLVDGFHPSQDLWHFYYPPFQFNKVRFSKTFSGSLLLSPFSSFTESPSVKPFLGHFYYPPFPVWLSPLWTVKPSELPSSSKRQKVSCFFYELNGVFWGYSDVCMHFLG